MPVATPNITFYPSPGNNTFTVTVPSTAPASVNFYADLGGECVLATVAAGGSATFLAFNGFFTEASSATTFTVSSASQGFQNSPVLVEYQPSRQFNVLSNSTLGLNTLYFQPFDIQQSFYASRINFYVSMATTFTTTANATMSAGLTLSAALYSRASATSASDQLTQIWSQSAYINANASSGSNLSVSQYLGISNSSAVSSASTALATSNASTYMATSIGGFREFALPIGQTLAPGRYWLAFANSTASANGSMVLNMSVAQETYSNQINFQPFGGASSASNASYPQFNDGLGSYSATSGAFPASVALTGGVILGAPSAGNPIFNMSGYAANLSEN